MMSRDYSIRRVISRTPFESLCLDRTRQILRLQQKSTNNANDTLNYVVI